MKKIDQCSAVVLYGRDGKGNRSGLIPPRSCQRPATQGSYCGLHARQADLQDLLRECLAPSWEATVKQWADRQRVRAEAEGRGVAKGLAVHADKRKLYSVAAFLRQNQRELGEVWAEVEQVG